MGYLKIKEILDVILSVFVLIITFPILILIVLAIKVESKGPALFVQERLGQYGKVFKIYKFRTMCINAEKGGVYEVNNDSRVTKVGKVLRRTSIDEFPQFINVLKGEMSIIGPRPPLTYHPWPLNEYTKVQKKRFRIKPGITGLAQINGRKGISWEQRIKYDVEYVEKMSFGLDVKILFITIIKAITMKDNVNIGKTSHIKKNI